MAFKTIEVEISPSRMRAFVTVRPEEGLISEGAQIWENLIEAELRASGVVFGVDHEAILDLIKNRKWGAKIAVANGNEPKPGEHGRVEYLFDVSRQPRPRQSEDGKVDYREIDLIQVVNKDDLLARLIPPKDGVPGKTVEGNDMPARAGLAAILQGGLNTHFSDPQKRELRALTPGSVSLARGMVQVDNTLVVNGNVDFSSGNLIFTGDIIVRGDVKSGFRVKTECNIQVHGIVEDAIVEAGGDVLIKGGFEGSGRGIIRSGGKVHLKFVENQTIFAQGSVYVGELALHANIEAGDSIMLTSGKGAIIGGHVKARNAITARVIGNPQQTPTVVEIEREPISAQDLTAKEADLTVLQQEILGLKTSLDTLQKLKQTEKAQAAEIEIEIRKMVAKLQQVKANYDRKRLEYQKIQKKIADYKKTGIVTVTEKIFPGVQVIIGNESHKIKETRAASSFKPSEDEIATGQEVPA